MRWRSAISGLAVIAAGSALAATAPRAQLPAFARVQPGSWTLRALDGSEPPRTVCLADPDELIQLRHPGASCSRFVLGSSADAATIHYTCAGAGYGRTTITVESGTLIKVESQGLAGSAPFEMRLEGRRSGACGQNGAVR